MAKSAEVKKGPRQESLPGMKNRRIAALQDAALAYAEIRDQRCALTEQEVALKKKLLELMHKYDKETYTFGSVTIVLVHEDESVKVKVSKTKDPAEEEAAEGEASEETEETVH